MTVRQRLVEAGVELLERDGLENLTQRRITDAAGVSHGAPRHHFPTFANLLAAIARAGIDDLDRVVADCLAGPEPRSALMRTCSGIVDFAARRPAMFELIARHDLLDGAGGELRGTTGRWLVAVTERLREIRPNADERHALALWAGVQGLGIMVGRRGRDAITTSAVDPAAVLAVLLDGLLGNRTRAD